jgi:cytochrome c5
MAETIVEFRRRENALREGVELLRVRRGLGLALRERERDAWRIKLVERKLPNGKPTTGKELYQSYCAACHKADLTGGSNNYGGPVATASGLVFLGATVYDKKFRAFDAATGKVLSETTLPASGTATPAVYEVNGRQFVVIAAGGGKWGEPSGGSYVAFALP